MERIKKTLIASRFAIQEQHPDWTPEQVTAEFVRVSLEWCLDNSRLLKRNKQERRS